MSYRIDLDSFIQEKSQEIDGYLGCILIGSEATGYAKEDSDIEMHVFLDQTQNKRSNHWLVDGIVVRIIAYPLDGVLSRIKNSARSGSYVLWIIYGHQGVILDDPYNVVAGIVSKVKHTPISKGYSVSDVAIWQGDIYEKYNYFLNHKSVLISSDPYDTLFLSKYFMRILETYTYFIGYNSFASTVTLGYYKKINRILNDDDYALNHWGRIFPDKDFVDIWNRAIADPGSGDFNKLFHYVNKRYVSFLREARYK